MNNLARSRLAGILLLLFPLAGGLFSESLAAEKLDKSEKSDNTVNFSIDPFGFLSGVSNISMEWLADDNMSLGPSLSLMNISSRSTTGTAVGIGAVLTATFGHKIYTNGVFIRPFLDYSVAAANSLTATGIALGASVGYWWFWKSGLNLGVGLGYQYTTMNLASLGLSTAGGRVTELLQIGYNF